MQTPDDPDDQTQPQLRDNPAQRRFEVLVDGELAGYAAYDLDGEVLVFTHTEVQPPHEGQGLAARLARYGLDEVRRRGLRAVPACSYIAAYLRRHPADAALVDARG
jgi:predicted GNAT family acetyltransferase